MAISLDRIAIEEKGADPVRLARAIHRQLPDLTGAVPVHDIAYALDIQEIREEPLSSIEGCLLTDRCKSYGDILVNAASGPRRRRYTVGHELGHFLNEGHVPAMEDGFYCTKDDMGRPVRTGRYFRQESEANRFAIELLAPERLVGSRLGRAADLEHAISMAGDLEISREAAARRYVELHGECLAVVFSLNDQVRYIEKGSGFPRTSIWTNDVLPLLPPRPRDGSDLTTLDEVSPLPWLGPTDGVTLFAQTLFQAEGYAMTLLLVERAE